MLEHSTIQILTAVSRLTLLMYKRIYLLININKYEYYYYYEKLIYHLLISNNWGNNSINCTNYTNTKLTNHILKITEM